MAATRNGGDVALNCNGSVVQNGLHTLLVAWLEMKTELPSWNCSEVRSLFNLGC